MQYALKALRELHVIFDVFHRAIEERGGFAQKASLALVQDLRSSDPILKQAGNLPEDMSEERKAFCHEQLINLTRELYREGSKAASHRDVYSNPHVLRFFARQPERMTELVALPEKVPALFAMFEQGGKLAQNRDNVLRTLCENGNIQKKAKRRNCKAWG